MTLPTPLASLRHQRLRSAPSRLHGVLHARVHALHAQAKGAPRVRAGVHAPRIFDFSHSQPPTSFKTPKCSGSFPTWRLSHSRKAARKLDESENYSTCDEEQGRVPSYVDWGKEAGRDVDIEASQIERFESVQRMLNKSGAAKTTEHGVEISSVASSTDKALERASMRVSEKA